MVRPSQIAFGLITVFVATFMLFFIFDNLEKLSQRCKTENLPLCNKLNSFTMSMMIILLIIGGFVITICGTAYIMLSG